MTSVLTPQSIDQLLPSYSGFDAIGNHVTLIKELLEERGFKSDIYAEQWNGTAPHPCTLYKKYPHDAPKDRVVIYHHSVASGISRWLYSKPVFTVLSYHNITPYPYFHEPYDYEAFIACSRGRSQMTYLRNITDMTWSVSSYNQIELKELAFSEPHLLFPVLRHYDRLVSEPRNTEIISKLKQRSTLLFVGRVSPHKSHIDMIYYLSVLKRDFVKDLRIVFVGGGHPKLFDRLDAKAKELGLVTSRGLKGDWGSADVVFAEQVNDSELASFYEGSKMFLCLSEHEGFCVPLVEAMNFGIPIVAHDAAAIPETLGDGGLLIDKFDFDSSIKKIGEVLTSPKLLEQLASASTARAKDFSWKVCTGSFDLALEQTLNSYHDWRQSTSS